MSKRKHPAGGETVVMVVAVVVMVVAVVVLMMVVRRSGVGKAAEAVVYTRLLLCALFIALNRKHSSLGPKNFPEFNETFQTQVG